MLGIQLKLHTLKPQFANQITISLEFWMFKSQALRQKQATRNADLQNYCCISIVDFKIPYTLVGIQLLRPHQDC